MRSWLLPAVTLVGLVGCEQRFSADPQLGPEGLAPAPSSSSSIDALLASPSTQSASGIQDTSRAMTVTLCSASPQECATSGETPALERSYHVVFGSGRGFVRSRGQAKADLYKELRDRTKSGEELDAEPRAIGDGGAPRSAGADTTTNESADNSDPIAECAAHLLEVVDRAGSVSLDVIHAFGSTGCKVSLGRAAGDAGASFCLVKGPERPEAPKRGGLSF